MHKLLVIIVTYNGMKWLDQCLSSVSNSSISADLFIVDNGSKDGSIEFIKDKYPKAMLTVSEKNLGFGAANNLGFKFALKNDYDYVYLLNQDAWIEHQTFEKLIKIHKTHTDFGILSPLQVNREKNHLDLNFSLCCNHEMLSDTLCGVKISEVYSTKFVMAAHWLISKDCLETVGLFSPSFHHYGEDCNYIDRVLYHKRKVGIAPGCKGVHDRDIRFATMESMQYKFFTDNIVLLSNPIVKNRYIRVLGRYIINLFKNPQTISLRYLIKILFMLKKISVNRQKSKKDRAFIH